MRLLALLVAASVIPPSCNSSIASDAAALAGTWHHVRGASEPPGFFREFTLTVSDTTLSGTGTWQGEAGPSGNLEVSGYLSGKTVRLDFVFHTTRPAAAPPYSGHFDGQMTSTNDLVGAIRIGAGGPGPEHFAKG